LRSSVASKRFLLSDERLARFRFARMFFTQGNSVGLFEGPERILRDRFRFRAN
jgi:hypothetical protein